MLISKQRMVIFIGAFSECKNCSFHFPRALKQEFSSAFIRIGIALIKSLSWVILGTPISFKIHHLTNMY